MTTTHLPAVYRRASDMIRVNGWMQGDFYDRGQAGRGVPPKQCRMCLLGAVDMASFEGRREPWLSREEEIRDLGPIVAAMGLSHELDGVDAMGQPVRPQQVIGPWNDAPERTVEQVLDVLESAAVAAESGGAA